jgi:SAM-dependent methyltransferase/uncharacterized protein YbaR (Trm112 family)
MVAVPEDTIPRSKLDRSLDYLICPKDKADLRLNAGSLEHVGDGEFICSRCDVAYKIRSGAVHFTESPPKFEFPAGLNDGEIIEYLSDSVKDPQLIRAQMGALGTLLSDRYDLLPGMPSENRKMAIQNLFDIVKGVVTANGLDESQQASILVAANEARYDMESYRHPFTIPASGLVSAKDSYRGGAIVEIGSATGNCLNYFSTELTEGEFFIGVDISTRLVRQAQARAEDNMLFIQADAHHMPIRAGTTGIVFANNVWDRLSDPEKVVREIGRMGSGCLSLVIGQCEPQYESNDGSIVYVPEGKRLSPEEIMAMGGFKIVWSQKNVAWKPHTFFDGRERLPTECYHGVRVR